MDEEEDGEEDEEEKDFVKWREGIWFDYILWVNGVNDISIWSGRWRSMVVAFSRAGSDRGAPKNKPSGGGGGGGGGRGCKVKSVPQWPWRC